MNNMLKALSESQPCFGKYENWDNSWHCKGCIIKDECAANSNKAEEEKENG